VTYLGDARFACKTTFFFAYFVIIYRVFLLSVWAERRNKKEPRTRSRYRSPN